MTEPKSDKPLRPDLQQVLESRAAILDDARPKAVAQQRKRGRWTAREGIAALVDRDSFVEYGGLARPAVSGMTGAADGVVMGTAQIEGRPVDLLFYDYTVYAGTQSAINHMKTTRMFEHAERHRLPVVCWLDGMCDVLIATKDSTLGMAGPPLVEAALGVKLTPEEIGPASVHVASGVIDVLVEDEAEAIAVARQYLGYFGGATAPGAAPDGTALRDVVPDNPRRAYNVRKVIEGIADIGSVLELKAGFGRAVVTSLIRIAGRPVGVVANQPMFLAGAIDSPASDKAAHFIQICDAFDIPILSLCDTPGLMVGPDVERTGLVRKSARVLTAFANATVPVMTVVLRKAYGLGYYVMGSQPLNPAILLAWPTAEYGGMGLEGA